MSKRMQSISWVVYRMTLHGKPSGVSAVCEQSEWDVMEKDRPGYHTLIRGGIASEGEAEILARSTAVAAAAATAAATAAARAV